MGNLKLVETQEERIRKHLTWAGEARQIHSVWREDSWNDSEYRDGFHWKDPDIALMKKKGINPLTINRIFPVLNLILGNYINGQRDMIAKGRTKKDSELGQTMTECLAFVNDQNNGTLLQRLAFEDQITAGFGSLEVCKHYDPRKEVVWLKHHSWYNMWWDPYASPWMNKDECRYAYTATWKDTEDLKMLFPKVSKEIDEVGDKLYSGMTQYAIDDQGDRIEDYKHFLGSSFWVGTDRSRVRPIEMWYPKAEWCTFAKMHDGTVIDLDTLKSPREEIEVITYSREILKAVVKKMWVTTFLDNLELQNVPTPYAHDDFPFIPYVGYLDRFKFPFGIPRQLKEQNMEVNKRRSMALALINNRRVTIEDKAARSEAEAFREANRPDGFIVMKRGKLKAINIEEMGNLAQPQIDLMLQSEKEINEISGSNAESLQYNIPNQSGVALESRKQNTSVITASLLENARISQKMLGERVMALVQSDWSDEKVLRVVDRLTGAEKFVTINERIYSQDTGAIEVKNDITQGRFDVIIASKPITDTVREKNIELLFAAINKASAEAMPIILDLAFELSDLPQKDQLMARLRAVTGVVPLDDDLSMAEQKQKQIDEYLAKQAKEEESYQIGKEEKIIALDERKAKIENLRADAVAKTIKAQADKLKAEQDGWVKGQQLMIAMQKGGNNDTAG